MLASPPRSGRAQTAIALIAIGALELLLVAMWRLRDLKLHVIPFIALALAAGLIYFLALYALEHTRETRAAFWLVLAGAVLFRLTLAPLAPSLSTDVHRYRWDGHVQQAGWNPYVIAPKDPRLASLRDAGWTVMPGPETPTIYPPLAELVFRLTWRLLPSAVGFKLPFLLADLLVVGLLASWIRWTGGKAAQLAVYAWNPLVIVEFAASGHNDALALAGMVAALVIIRRVGAKSTPRAAGAASTLLITAAALAKAFPAVLLPLWLRRTRWQNALWAAAVTAMCAWPYRSAWPGYRNVLQYYESQWKNQHASLYAVAAWLSGSTDLAAGLGIGIVFGLALWLAARRAEPARAAFLLVGAILMLAPNGYSWYFTWIVPLVVLNPASFSGTSWLLLTVLQFLSYNVLIDYRINGRWQFDPLFQWLTYAPFYALLVGQTLLHGRNPAAAQTAAAPSMMRKETGHET